MKTLTAPAILPVPAEPGPGRLETTPDAMCCAPRCSLTLSAHPAGSIAYHVDGFPVGSAQCAIALDEHRRNAGPCCDKLPGDVCQCAAMTAQLAAATRRPAIVFRFGGNR